MQFVLLALLGALLWPEAGATQPGPEERAERYSRVLRHGFSSVPRELRGEVSRDGEVLPRFESLLNRPGALPEGVSVATVLWWLAESGDSRYVPLFVRFSSDPGDEVVFETAVYGLARNAAVPAARARLGTLARQRLSAVQMNHLATVLMFVGDAPAREVLRSIRGADLAPAIRTSVTQLLASPAGEKGRWPCTAPEVFIRDTDGRFRCRPGSASSTP